MARYLETHFIQSALNRGKVVECFLGGAVSEGEPTIRWVALSQDGDEVVVRLYEAFDPRDPEYLDIYSFRFLGEEGDKPVSEDRFATFEAAIEHAHTRCGADPARFTNEGVTQDEYGDYLAKLRSAG